MSRHNNVENWRNEEGLDNIFHDDINVGDQVSQTPSFIERQNIEKTIDTFTILDNSYIPHGPEDRWKNILKDLSPHIVQKAEKSPEYRQVIEGILNDKAPCLPEIISLSKQEIDRNFSQYPPTIFFSPGEIVRAMTSMAPENIKHKMPNSLVFRQLEQHVKMCQMQLTPEQKAIQCIGYISQKEKNKDIHSFETLSRVLMGILDESTMPSYIKDMLERPEVFRILEQRLAVSPFYEYSEVTQQKRFQQAVEKLKIFQKDFSSNVSPLVIVRRFTESLANSSQILDQKIAKAIQSEYCQKKLIAYLETHYQPEVLPTFQDGKNILSQFLKNTPEEELLKKNPEKLFSQCVEQLKTKGNTNILALFTTYQNLFQKEIYNTSLTLKKTLTRDISQKAVVFERKNANTFSSREEMMQAFSKNLSTLEKLVYSSIQHTFFSPTSQAIQKTPQAEKPQSPSSQSEQQHEDESLDSVLAKEKKTLLKTLDSSENIKDTEAHSKKSKQREQQEKKLPSYLFTIEKGFQDFINLCGFQKNEVFITLVNRIYKVASGQKFSEQSPFTVNWLKNQKRDTSLWKDVEQFFAPIAQLQPSMLMSVLQKSWKTQRIIIIQQQENSIPEHFSLETLSDKKEESAIGKAISEILLETETNTSPDSTEQEAPLLPEKNTEKPDLNEDVANTMSETEDVIQGNELSPSLREEQPHMENLPSESSVEDQEENESPEKKTNTIQHSTKKEILEKTQNEKMKTTEKPKDMFSYSLGTLPPQIQQRIKKNNAKLIRLYTLAFENPKKFLSFVKKDIGIKKLYSLVPKNFKNFDSFLVKYTQSIHTPSAEESKPSNSHKKSPLIFKKTEDAPEDSEPENSHEKPIGKDIEQSTHEKKQELVFEEDLSEILSSMAEHEEVETEEAFIAIAKTYPEIIEWLKKKEKLQKEKDLYAALYMYFLAKKRENKTEKQEKNLEDLLKSLTPQKLTIADFIVLLESVLLKHDTKILSHIHHLDLDTHIVFSPTVVANVLKKIQSQIPPNSCLFLSLDKGIHTYTFTLSLPGAQNKTPLPVADQASFQIEVTPKFIDTNSL